MYKIQIIISIDVLPSAFEDKLILNIGQSREGLQQLKSENVASFQMHPNKYKKINDND